MNHRRLVPAGRLVCIAMLAAACGGSKEQPAARQAPVLKPVDPAALPVPPGAASLGTPPASLGDQPAAMVTDLASGWPIALRVGQRMTARLAVDRTAGARWSMRAGSDGGVVALEAEPAPEQGSAGGVEVFALKAVRPGSTTLTFDFKKGTGPAALRSVSYPVTVQ